MSVPSSSNDDLKTSVLEKSRNSKQDEGVDFAENRGTKIGVIVYAVVAVILLICSIPNRTDILHSVAALSFAWVVGGTFSHYRFTKRKVYPVCSVGSAIATIANLLMVVLQILK